MPDCPDFFDHLEIEFEKGFQVLTGETGAGKSILVGALGLLCGERGQSDLVRLGADKAILEAEFEVSIDSNKKDVFENSVASGISLIVATHSMTKSRPQQH